MSNPLWVVSSGKIEIYSSLCVSWGSDCMDVPGSLADAQECPSGFLWITGELKPDQQASQAIAFNP